MITSKAGFIGNKLHSAKVLTIVFAAIIALTSVSAEAVVRQAPGAPQLISLTSGDKTISISIDAPLDQGSAPVTQYSYALNGGSWNTLGPATIAKTVKTIRVAANGVDYAVTVRARNSVGWGAVLQAGTVRPTAPPTIYPDAPTIISAYDTGCHWMRIEFTKPNAPYGKITRYRYQLGDGVPWNNSWTTDGVKIIQTAWKRPFMLRIQAFDNSPYSGWGATAEIQIDNRFPSCPFSIPRGY